jgi:uncharacterized membrane protein YkvA (DUF1232 family)
MSSLFRRAQHLIRNPEELLSTLTQALGKAYAKRSILYKIFEDFLLLFRLVRAWVLGDYKEVPRKTIFWAVIAILYFLSPLDFIPDLFPGGYIDDITVISFVLKKIKDDLEKFSGWEKEKKS